MSRLVGSDIGGRHHPMTKENTIRKLLNDSGSIGIGSQSSRYSSVEFEVP